MTRRIVGVALSLLSILAVASPWRTALGSPEATIGVNVLLNTPPSVAVVAQLEAYGKVLDVMPQIRAVTLRTQPSSLAAIRALGCVVAANPDELCSLLGASGLPFPDCSAGMNTWNLDAIDVTDFGGARALPYDGDGVYIAVIDSGLPYNWREYFPEERIASQFAISFGGGGGNVGTISSSPETWEHDTLGHGSSVISVLLGFSYYGTQVFNGVAPRATVIPIKTYRENNNEWESVNARAILHVVDLKTSGALGVAPVVLNLSFGSATPQPLYRAAVDYAIASGVIVVAAAGNSGTGGMGYPAAYPEVISAGAIGSVHQAPIGNPVWWLLDDFAESDPSQSFVTGFSSRELPDQDLDLVAPGVGVPVAYTKAGQVDYNFFIGSSAACPHVAGVAALMLQKNPDLAQAQVEAILEATAMPIAPACRSVIYFSLGAGNEPSWSDLSNVNFFPATFCWNADATGHGLVQAGSALSATPNP